MRIILAAVFFALGGCGLAAQSAGTVPDTTLTLTSGTNLVVVDVTVLGRNGEPVHGLKAGDFVLTENRTPQQIKSFDEHTDQPDPKAAAIPPLHLPAGTFTDFSPVPADAPLNVLLLDTLNTPLAAQSYVRYQLQQYVKHAGTNARIAIFGLGSRLYLLQGFTTDPAILRAVVEKKLLPRTSVLLDTPGSDPQESNSDVAADTAADTPDPTQGTLASAGATDSVVANLQQFEADTASYRVQMRTRYTLDAFNALGRYLGAFPGRKNILWFSGAFPITLFGDATLADPFAVASDAAGEMRETSVLLSRARVAVYPIDARGLEVPPQFSAENAGRGYARNPAAFGRSLQAFTQTQAAEHSAMDTLAEETGGKAFYNTNGLAQAVTSAIQAGQNFYTLTYSPTNRKFDGSYRTIKLKPSAALAAAGDKLTYREGYYANDPSLPYTSLTANTSELSAANTRRKLVATALDFGAPTPSEILFKALVVPASTGTFRNLLPRDQPSQEPVALHAMKGPFRRLIVDLAVLPRDLHLAALADGTREGSVSFLLDAYDSDGDLINSQSTSAGMRLKPQTYATMLQEGLKAQFALSVPARGESFLRLAVIDDTIGRIGVVELPVSSVIHLAPPPEMAGTPVTKDEALPPAATPARSAPAGKP